MSINFLIKAKIYFVVIESVHFVLANLLLHSIASMLNL